MTEEEIEAKYSKIIDDAIKRNWDKSISLLWQELDLIKGEMKAELDASKSNKVDTKDEGSTQ